MKKTLLLLLVVSCACSSPRLVVKKDVKIETLGIYFEAGPQSMPIISNYFERVLDDYIKRHNAQAGRPFLLRRPVAADSSSLKIKLVGTRLVTPGQQAGGVAVSMIGLALPFLLISLEAPIIVFFYYFPDVKSLTEFSLSPDIGATAQPAPFVLSSPGFLKNTERQINTHAVHFRKLLQLLIKEVEKAQK